MGKLASRNIIILVSVKCSINKTYKCVLQYKKRKQTNKQTNKQRSHIEVQYNNYSKSCGKENMHNISTLILAFVCLIHFFHDNDLFCTFCFCICNLCISLYHCILHYENKDIYVCRFFFTREMAC